MSIFAAYKCKYIQGAHCTKIGGKCVEKRLIFPHDCLTKELVDITTPLTSKRKE